jgi:hypothetical protein
MFVRILLPCFESFNTSSAFLYQASLFFSSLFFSFSLSQFSFFSKSGLFLCVSLFHSSLLLSDFCLSSFFLSSFLSQTTTVASFFSHHSDFHLANCNLANQLFKVNGLVFM